MIVNWLNNNQGLLAVIIFVLGGIATLIWWLITKNKNSTTTKSSFISAGKNISAGGDIIVRNKVNKERKTSKSSLKVNLAQNEVSWTKYAISKWVWPSFRLVLEINNYHNNSPEYIKAYLVANSNDGQWKATNYIFRNTKNEDDSQPNQEYRIEPKFKEKVAVFISNYDIGLNERKPMPDIDKDTLKLILETESKKKVSIKIKPAWIKQG
ncbi:MAG: hypothetical protein U9P73_11335 [Candidatus Cloacimonadota bacterium]|nr:hypothetical protein [Candidatus Cloacimonadota bacterium]